MGAVLQRIRKLARTAAWWLSATPAERRHFRVGPPDLWVMKRAFQIAFLRKRDLRPGQTFLDLGCGTLRGGLPIIQYLDAEGYCGIDVREKALVQARRELRQAKLEHKRPRLELVGDLTALDLGRRFDVVWAFSVLVHMPDAVLEGCFRAVAKHLAPDGVFYADVRVGEAADEARDGYFVATRDLSLYRETARKFGLEVRDLGTLESLGHVSGNPEHDEQRMLEISRAEA